MSLRIKLPKQSAQTQIMESARVPKPSKRRIDSDDEDEELGQGSRDDNPARLRGKRGRTEESSVGGGDTGVDDELDADMNIDIEADPDDTRFLPPPVASTSASPPPSTKISKRSTSSAPSKARGKSATSSSSRSSARKPKRTVVWTDSEDDGEEYQDAGQVMDPEDEDFSPEPRPTSSKKAAATAKVKHGKPTTGKGTKNNAKKNDKEIVIRDERKIPPPATSTPKEKPSMPIGSKRPAPKDEDEDMDIDVSGSTRADSPDKSKVAPPTKLEDPAPPPLKKRKLPTIKKNKTSTAPSTPSTAKPSISDEKKDTTTTVTTASTLVGVAARKPAATAGNADFDLRDKSVYAQLFNKPGGSTPNSGLNRKEKEEERRKELNKMRDEARAKRAEEAKHSFDLQAAHEKISRFEEKFRARKSMAAFPNVLGGYFKAVYDEACRRETERHER